MAEAFFPSQCFFAPAAVENWWTSSAPWKKCFLHDILFVSTCELLFLVLEPSSKLTFHHKFLYRKIYWEVWILILAGRGVARGKLNHLKRRAARRGQPRRSRCHAPFFVGGRTQSRAAGPIGAPF